MLPNNLITHFILSGLIGSIYGYLLCWLTWTLTDMDLSWHRVRHLTKELEGLTEELTGKNNRMDELLNELSDRRTRKYTAGWETKGDNPPDGYPMNPTKEDLKIKLGRVTGARTQTQNR